MKKLLIITLIFILTINLIPTSVNDSASAQEQRKTTDLENYTQGDPIEITLRIPGGTDLYTQPANIVLLLDRSVSMLNPMGADPTWRIKAAVSALKDFLNAADPTKHRIAFATFGSGGYWHTNFSTDYTAIRNKLNNLESEIIANKAGAFAGWECTSNGDGLKLAVDKLIADSDEDPDYVILASDGAENGQLHQVDSVTDTVFWNIRDHTSSFIENNNAVVDAKNAGITIHTIGISSELDEDYSGTFNGIPKDSELYLGRKCGRIYHPSRHGNLGWRSGTALLRDYIAAPTGGIYSRVGSMAALKGVYIDILDDIVGALDIRVYDQIRSDVFNNITAIDPTPGCSGDDKYVAGSLQGGVGTHGFNNARYNQLEKGEVACIKISTTIKKTSPTGFGQEVDARHEDCPSGATYNNSGCIEILNDGTWLNDLKKQIEIEPLIGPWLLTACGNVGSKGAIEMEFPVPPNAAQTGCLGAARYNTDYLVTAAGTIDLFTSILYWELESYDATIHGPDWIDPADHSKGYDYYNWLYNRYSDKIQVWSQDAANDQGCTNPGGGPGSPGKCIPNGGFWYIDSNFTIVDKTYRGAGTEPTVIFIKNNLILNDLTLYDVVDIVRRPLIFIVGGNVTTSISHDKAITDFLRGWPVYYTGQNIPTTYYKGFFFVNGRFTVPNAQGLTTVYGAVVANKVRLWGDIGKSDNSMNDMLPSERFQYDAAVLWHFRNLLGESRIIYREVAP